MRQYWIKDPRKAKWPVTKQEAIDMECDFHVLEAAPCIDELRAAREAIQWLLDDTQHAKHNCGDDRCPVDNARKSLARIDAFLKMIGENK